jgi:release factor glutamine methyltransferase
MVTVLEALAKNYQDLLNHNIQTAKIDTEVILADVLKISRVSLITKQNTVLNQGQEDLFAKFIKRRKQQEPVAYILNKKEFWNENYYVDKRVLIPRPETEILIEMLLKKVKDKSKVFQILDLGCGSGCLLISCLKEFNKSLGLGIDISSLALEVAKKNIQSHKINSRAKLLKLDLFKLDIKKKFDFILSNPPYLTSSEYRNLSKDVKDYEPKQALVGGFDGILYYKKIISFSKSSLKKNGFLALEIGDGQYKEIKKLLTNHSFRILDKYQLIDGEIRCILASKIE